MRACSATTTSSPNQLIAAGSATGEKLWRLPLGPKYDKMIDSKVADMKNTGGKWGGSISAAQFLQRFIKEGTPWAHLDIAGTAMSSVDSEINRSWGSGFGVRLLDRLIADHYERPLSARRRHANQAQQIFHNIPYANPRISGRKWPCSAIPLILRSELSPNVTGRARPSASCRAMPDEAEKRYTLDDLLAVMARLRDKDAGCPWDVEQSFATIAPYTIEEAYEVADAIARDDLDALKDELGDLLLQVVYHAQMASEHEALRLRRCGRRNRAQDDPPAPACVRRCESR